MAHDLNPPQREAVSTLSGPLLVLAGAGTGKTRVVTYRIARLIKQGIRPSRILAVTFTNKAASEMQQRCAALLGRRQEEKPEISTFHSLCVRILRRQIDALGYPKQFAIYDRGDQEGLARAALRELRIANESLRPRDLLYFVGTWKSRGVGPNEAAAMAETDKEHLAAAGFRRYQKSLKAVGAVDFDDLLVLVDQLFAEFPDVRREEAARFDHLLVDEYQDTNITQYRIIKALALPHRNLCVVGDDDQSIYGWRGAEVEHILRFGRDWPDARVVRLEDNYRSTEEILRVANRLIAFNKTRHDKVLRAARRGGERPALWQLPTEEDEAEAVVKDIKTRLTQSGIEPRDFAILFRTNEQPRAFETALREADVPYVLIGGMSFYDRKEVRDVLAYLKVLASGKDEVSLLRIINTPPRGIGQSSVAALMEEAVSRGKPLGELLSSARRIDAVTTKAAEAIERFFRLIESYRARARRGGSLVKLTTALIDEIGYREELTRLYKDPKDQQTRWAAVEEVINALGAYERKAERPTIKGFLDQLALEDRDDDDKDDQLRRNAVALMTLHSAKGLEFPQVYLVGLEEGMLPHRRSVEADEAAIEEERRLCYVGLTRAQDRLTLSLSLSRMKWGKPRETDPSRFLYELTGQADNPHAAVPKAAQRKSSSRG
ncbi:MAG: UvrD-helicase domain-containing protein, partial [Planctomycetes bacterium]|nr:UvrD-helicase domain-containing protein [Planctomycetota bacterium]